MVRARMVGSTEDIFDAYSDGVGEALKKLVPIGLSVASDLWFKWCRDAMNRHSGAVITP
jgi:hypothetical protein